jgi:ribosomal protein L15
VCTIDAKDTDEDLERIFEDDDGEAYTCFGKAHHRAEINLDVIAEAFCDGDLVTLESLKRKRLVPKKTDYVKVLARGTLSKPLIIEANDFSRAAEEMLIALGGEAIRVRH